jgi:hypothetical protein
MAESFMRYTIVNNAILIDGEPVARIQFMPGEFAEARVADLLSAANRGIRPQTQTAPVVPTIPGVVDEIDHAGAGGFLAGHHVPIIGPDMGIELIKIVKRLEIVEKVYPLPPAVDVYRLALHLVVTVAADHQRAFCTRLERVLDESD